MGFDIVSIGSATLDIFLKSPVFGAENGLLDNRVGEKIDVDQAEIATGGAATNTSVAFARMGFSAACITEIGTDFAGDMVLHDLQDEGVSVEYVVSERSENTAIAALLVGGEGGRTALVYRGASRMITADDVDWEQLQTKRLHLSSVGDAGLIARTFQFCREKSVKLSWNPGNWEIERIASGEMKPDWSVVDVLCLNREEMTKMSGRDLSTDEAWKSAWCFDGPRISIITDGKNGGRYCVSGNCSWYEGNQVRAVQETGAGDAFVAGVVSGLLMDLPIEQCVGIGKANAASVVQSMGAKRGLLWKNDLADLLR